MTNQSPVNRVAEQVSETSERIGDKSKEIVKDHPLPLALTAFGLGAGLGLIVAAYVSEITDSRQRGWAERMGDELRDALAHIVPNKISRAAKG
jgi:hypothetical protein